MHELTLVALLALLGVFCAGLIFLSMEVDHGEYRWFFVSG